MVRERPSGIQRGVVAAVAGMLAPLRITPRGGAFLGAGAIGVLVSYAAGWPALLAVALFLIGAVLAAIVIVVLSPPALAIDRLVDPLIAEQRKPVRVQVGVRGSSAGAVEWLEELPRSVVVNGRAEGVLTSVRADRPTELLHYEFAAGARGAVPIGPLRIARTDPLGLATSRRRVGGVDRVTVLPRIHQVDLPFAVRRSDPDARASTVFGAAGDQRDIVARAYRTGDPLRSVDWRATARRAELMVRTETAASSASTALILDTRQEAWPESAAFEWAVEYAASLIVALQERQSEVRLAAGAGRVAEATAALVSLAEVDRGAGRPTPIEEVQEVATAEVQVVHLLTGAGGVEHLHRLSQLPNGALGLVSVIARRPCTVDAPVGWQVVQRDSAAAVGTARDD